MDLTFLLACLVSVPAAVPGIASPCSPGIVVADDCFGISAQGCCTADNSVRWCQNGVLCELSCKGKGACGWKSKAGRYECFAKPTGDPSCANPYSCFVGGCAPAILDKGCCGCPCEECVCAKDPYCCKVSWDQLCVDLCKECGGCGGGNGCTPVATPGCSGCACEMCVCQMDPYCCTVKWDSLCIKECVEECGGECEPCKPNCEGKECGPDGCFGLCGVCPPGWKCGKDQKCEIVCTKSCVNKECGDDGCGGSCGECTPPKTCKFGKCVEPPCQPNCEGKECGDDGCNGSCGECPIGQSCVEGQCVEGVCVPNCKGKECGDDGCGGMCGWCPPGFYCGNSGKCEKYCVPQCQGKECGNDGCGGSCGSCPAGYICENNKCVAPCFPVCDGATCGPDYAGGSCGTCEPPTPYCSKELGYNCTAECTPDCTGVECGDDGCGGSCGECPPSFYCSMGICSPVCIPQCLVPPLFLTPKQCGCDGCGGICGVCPPGTTCAPGYICVEDKCSCENKFCGIPAEGCPNTCGECPEGMVCDMETVIDPETNVCEPCQPNCLKPDGTPKECGDDGCGGSCGPGCQGTDVCDTDPNDGDPFYFQCEPCQPNCLKPDGTPKECGDDGCGGSCGACPPTLPICQEECPPDQPNCALFTCVACTDNCLAPPDFIYPMECGPKNCPKGCVDKGFGPCKYDTDCAPGQTCYAATGQCVECETCGKCPPGWMCDAETEITPEIYVCVPCSPSCSGKECGPNGCGGSCGSCPVGYHCTPAGKCEKDCIPFCLNKSCGPDGCPPGCLNGTEPCGPYGKCPEGMMCDPGPNVCVTCTGTCGTCKENEYCASDYTCKPLPADPCAGKECGPNGRGGSCGECTPPFKCKEGICVDETGNPEGREAPEVIEQTEDIEPQEETGQIECGPDEELVDGKCVKITCPPQHVLEDGTCVPCLPPKQIFFGKCVEGNSQPSKESNGCAVQPGRSGSGPANPGALILLGLLLVFLSPLSRRYRSPGL